METYKKNALHERIFEMVAAIPVGKVATYGQIGKMVSGCSGQLVGFALASLRYGSDRKVPWQRVINRSGKISLTGPDAALQRALLEDEGIRFDAEGVIDLAEFGWKPEDFQVSKANTISVTFFDAPHAFYDQAHTLWEADETRNNLILGLVLRLQADLHAYGEENPLMALVKDETGKIVASALMTPPFALIVQSEPLVKPALEALADALIDNGWILPGVNCVDQVSDCFAEIWHEKTGQAARRILNMRAYELRQVLSIDYPSGEMKLAEETDAQLAADMLNAMAEEIMVGPKRLYTAQSMLEIIRKKNVFFWQDAGKVVSLTIANRAQIKGICIGGVYTPPAFRKRGYARALVAEVSKELLARGYELTNLFTDLANPTSNKIYQEVGYKPVCDYHQYEFVDRA